MRQTTSRYAFIPLLQQLQNYQCLSLKKIFNSQKMISRYHASQIVILLLYSLLLPGSIELSSYDTIVTLQGSAQGQQLNSCEFRISMGSHEAVIDLLCDGVTTNQSLLVNEQHQFETVNEHHFQILSKQKDKEIGVIVATAGKGVQWKLSADLMTIGDAIMMVYHVQLKNQFTICFLYGLYTLVVGLSLPPGAIFYKNMEGMGIYNLIVTLHLSLALLVNIVVTLFNYGFSFTFSLSNFVSILVLIVSLLCICMHLLYKTKTLILMSYKDRTRKTALVILILSLFICFMGVLIFINFHKEVFIYVYFGSGLIFYMCSFFLFKKMKKYFFSFRLVLADSCTILFLGASSLVYPIMHYEILAYYHIIGLILMVVVLLLNAGIAYILVNVIHRQIKERKQKNKIKKLQITDASMKHISDYGISKRRSMKIEEIVENQIIQVSQHSANSEVDIIGSKKRP